MIDLLPQAEAKPPRIVWSPLFGSQALAIGCPCNIIVYEGTRGPGKTDAQLMFFRKWVGQGFGKYWRGIIFDRQYKNLDDLVAKSQKWFPEFRDGAEFKLAKSDYKWVWPTGEELLFRSVERESDYWDYHGQEFPFIGWNELTKYPDPKLFDAMMSCNRSSFLPAEHSPKGRQIGEIPLVVFVTTNPYGAGHNWVKKRFIDVAEPGQVVRSVTNVFNPRTQAREDIVKTQVRIFGSYKENRFLSPLYIAELENITEPNKRRAWLWGDWDIVAGGALDDLWNPSVHVLPRFKVPKTWRIDRSLDWGSTKPFSVGWWAEANGEEVDIVVNGKAMAFCPPKGSLIRIYEWYGCAPNMTNEGLKLGSTEVAEGIREREKLLAAGGWISGSVWPGPADNSIRSVDDKDKESTEQKMAKVGIRWLESDKKPGSRKQSLQLFRDRLKATIDFDAGKRTDPCIFFMDCCRDSISTLPVLPRDEKDPDDVDTDAEDHIYDDCRYRILAGNNRFATSINVKMPT